MSYTYSVIRVPADSAVIRNDYRVDRDIGGGVDMYRCPVQESVDNFNLDDKRNTYFCDTEDQAYNLAYTLAKKFPGTQWITARSIKMINVSPGPVNVANFSDKGLLP